MSKSWEVTCQTQSSFQQTIAYFTFNFKILGHTFLRMAALQPALQLLPVPLELLYLDLQFLTPPSPLLLLLLQLLLERRDRKLNFVTIYWLLKAKAVSKRVCHFVVKSLQMLS